jgi:ribosomal protein S18 acetylase RimI-like enzyme
MNGSKRAAIAPRSQRLVWTTARGLKKRAAARSASKMEHLAGEFILADGRKVTLRPVVPEDEEFLLRVYASTREEELAQVLWDEGQKDAFLRQQSAAQRREYDAHYPDARYDVILLEGNPVGRIWVGRSDAEIHLLDIALLGEAQNLGVGTALLHALVEESERTNKRLTHTVFIQNTDALRFYQRLGFVVVEDIGAYLMMERRPRSDG